jgi:hypothetical protein
MSSPESLAIRFTLSNALLAFDRKASSKKSKSSRAMPQRSNDVWTPDEDELALSMKLGGASFVRIAAKLKRTITAVRGRHRTAKARQPLKKTPSNVQSN